MSATLTIGSTAAVADPLHVWLAKPDFPAALSTMNDRVDVPIKLNIDADGNLRCVPKNLKNHPELRRVSCVILVSRWPFAPKLDTKGNAIPTTFDLLVQWRPGMSDMELGGALPISPENWIKKSDYPLRLLLAGKTTVTFSITAGGKLTDCKVVESSRALVLDEAVCPLLRERALFLPALDGAGARTATLGRYTHHWPW